jgi:hypothetical protein
LLGDGDEAAREGEVVIGGEESDQTEGEAADRLGEPKLVKAQANPAPWAGLRRYGQFWRSRRLLAGERWPGGIGRGSGHGTRATLMRGCHMSSVPPLLPTVPALFLAAARSPSQQACPCHVLLVPHAPGGFGGLATAKG